MPKKIFIFGLDGATWNIINPLIARGDLPNLSRLKESGASGNLRSLEPSHSPIVWTTISSGKFPDKHGINFFISRSNMVKTSRIWDILEKQGLTVGIYGHLVTWPPRPIKGFIIPDDLLSQDAQTYPPEYTFLRQIVMDAKKGLPRGLFRYVEYLIKSGKFGIRWSHLLNGLKILVSSRILGYQFLDIYYRQRFLKEDIKSDAFIHLNRKHKCDFSFYYCNITDSCAHLYWKYMEPEKFLGTNGKEIRRFGNVVRDTYIKADAILGEILRSLDDTTSIWVVSDHGFKAATTNRSGNTLLIRTEFLTKVLSIEEKAQCSNLGKMGYLKLKKPFEGEIENIIYRINGLAVVENGHKIFTSYTDNKFKNIIHIRCNEIEKSLKGCHIQLGGNIYRCEDLVDESEVRFSGDHDSEGIFIMKSEGIKKGKWVEDECHVADITPTLLAYLGLPIARDMDGHVISQVFEEGYLIDNPLSYIDSYDEAVMTDETEDNYVLNEEVKKRLRDLGYLG